MSCAIFFVRPHIRRTVKLIKVNAQGALEKLVLGHGKLTCLFFEHLKEMIRERTGECCHCLTQIYNIFIIHQYQVAIWFVMQKLSDYERIRTAEPQPV